ncbi:T9SS type A sorting domain-containing protein [Flavobacterium ovatum]|uniref:T9SS type A sorting domain-containing protein n=1 Tax=Flavobacterium ovatum TaxID=1928857 RepID=UPI00344DF4AA
MKKLLLLFVTSLGAITISQAQQNLSLSTNATSLSAIVISDNGYILEETSTGVYAQRTITVTSTNDPGDGSGGYNNAFFVVKNSVPTNVATAGTLSTANATTVSIDPVDAAINTRTWVISLLTLSSGNITPLGAGYDFRPTGGTSSNPPQAVTIVPTYTIPVVEKHSYEFNNGTNTEGFNAINSAITVSGGKMIITTDAVAGNAPHAVGIIRKTDPTNYVNANTFKYAHVYYRNKSENNQLRISTGSAPSGTNGSNYTTLTLNMTDASPYEVAVVNLTNAVTWTGNIDTFDVQHRTSGNSSLVGTLEIDRIEFSTGATLGLNTKQVIEFVNVYPNPTTGAITISDLKDSKTINIFNMLGAVVKTLPATNTIDISDLATGTYILKTDTGLSSKIIKQ